MPIYEYRCEKCGRVSSFLVRNIAAHQTPKCPHCGASAMHRAVSRFAALRGSARSSASDTETDTDSPPPADTGLDENEPGDVNRPEPDLAEMESLLDSVDENDPRSMGRAMRRLAEQTGEPLDEEMEEVVRRLEAGEDPEKIEEKMGGSGEADAGGDELYDG